jgi:hypothetical protein
VIAGDVIAALALAVAEPGRHALLIDRNNDAVGWLSLPHAVSSGRCFTVKVAKDILALDADSVEKGRFVEEKARILLEAQGFPCVVVASGRDGHRHLFALIPEASQKETWASLFRKDGLDVRDTIRPPLAPHRSGLPVRLVYPVTPELALEALKRRGSVDRSRERKLSRRMYQLLRFGDREGRYKSRSEVAMAIATAAVNARKPLELPRFS